VKHQKVLDVPDNGNTRAVQSADWNGDHVLTGMLALLDALSGQANKVLTFDASGNPELLAKSLILTAASPALAGTPTAPTASQATNTDQIATTAFVKAAVATLVTGAPALLDTLDEIAAALGDDPNFAATMTALLALKAPLASPAFSGNPTVPTQPNTDKTTKVASMAAAYAITGARGQCVLRKSGTNLALTPVDGNLLTVNGINCTVPDSGVTLAPTGLTPGTNYYIYAVATSGVITSLEASTTAPVVDTTAGNVGVKIKTGDPTRSLVGFARPITGPAWQDTAAQRFVRSWFNERGGVPTEASFTTGRSTANPSATELNTEIRNEVLLWAGETWDLKANGSVGNATGSSTNTLLLQVDATGATGGAVGVLTAGMAGAYLPFCAPLFRTGLAEGYHYASLYALTDAGTVLVLGGGNGKGTITGKVLG
jgi:hypothetical protein